MYKKCRKCKTTKITQDFYYRSKAKDGLTSRCKECISEYNNKYPVVEVKAPAPRVNVWEWIKRLFG